MQKPFSELTPAEMKRLTKHLQALVKAEGDFPGVLGNKNSFLLAKPLPRKPTKAAKRAARAS